ncbi:hypothetical protein NUW58_g3633 [Xylaria curta]|uniref:Uncharacterized protein n=1 Tax=Xylaria curta TaxID=42375 RepID=A0ACC1PBL3_9PEZI|nr:hypothetical protein NUW58_g3633 [Xylaria curta]
MAPVLRPRRNGRWRTAPYAFGIGAAGANGRSRTAPYAFDIGAAEANENNNIYPHNQSHPGTAADWLALVYRFQPKTISLFPEPVGFVDHILHRVWLSVSPEFHNYTTVTNFVKYAKVELANEKAVLGLMTPWFFNIKQTRKRAEETGEEFYECWQRRCFRAGHVFLLSRTRKKPGSRKFLHRLVIFKPGYPTYPTASEPLERRAEQTRWIDHAISTIKQTFELESTWLGGSAVHHIPANPARGMAADSVEVSAEFIEEIMIQPELFPDEVCQLLDRRFQLMDRPKLKMYTPPSP